MMEITSTGATTDIKVGANSVLNSALHRVLPTELANRVFNYNQVYPFLDELAKTLVNNLWDIIQMTSPEDGEAYYILICRWDIYPESIYKHKCRMRFIRTELLARHFKGTSVYFRRYGNCGYIHKLFVFNRRLFMKSLANFAETRLDVEHHIDPDLEYVSVGDITFIVICYLGEYNHLRYEFNCLQ